MKTPEIVTEYGWDALPEALCSTFPELKERRVCLICDDKITGLYGADVAELIAPLCGEFHFHDLIASEQTKNLESVKYVYDILLSAQFDRHDILIAMGGGVTTDIAGYAAATYKRGIADVLIPTTIIGMVDAAIGGKTAVNFGGCKNSIGAFYMPELVYMNPEVLQSLPEEEIRSGSGEVIKTAMLGSRELFEELEERYVNAKALVTRHTIEECVRIKSELTEQDPYDHGARRLLNLGHTFGHAFESASGYHIKHGHAVGLGIWAASRISERRGLMTEEELKRIRAILTNSEMFLMTRKPKASLVLEAMENDKKRNGARDIYILPQGIGVAGVYDNISEDELYFAIEDLCK